MKKLFIVGLLLIGSAQAQYVSPARQAGRRAATLLRQSVRPTGAWRIQQLHTKVPIVSPSEGPSPYGWRGLVGNLKRFGAIPKHHLTQPWSLPYKPHSLVITSHGPQVTMKPEALKDRLWRYYDIFDRYFTIYFFAHPESQLVQAYMQCKFYILNVVGLGLLVPDKFRKQEKTQAQVQAAEWLNAFYVDLSERLEKPERLTGLYEVLSNDLKESNLEVGEEVAEKFVQLEKEKIIKDQHGILGYYRQLRDFITKLPTLNVSLGGFATMLWEMAQRVKLSIKQRLLGLKPQGLGVLSKEEPPPSGLILQSTDPTRNAE